MKYSKTHRGFQLIEFIDLYGKGCSIQKSSLATEDAVWIGIDDPDPQIMASLTKKGGTGWVKYEIPESVSIQTRMHICRKTAESIINVLQTFVATGELPQ